MDEIDYSDTVMDDFLSRFGDPNIDRFKSNKAQINKATNLGDASKLNTSMTETSDFLKGTNEQAKYMDGLSATSESTKSLGGKASGVMGKAGGAAGLMSMGTDIAQLASFAQGSQFDTTAEGGGPGKAGGAIMQGAATGAQAGAAFGPWGMVIGAAAGGLTSTFAHKGAMKKWRDNQKKANLKENALEKAENEEAYRLSQGQESMEALKSLREKQLGIIS